MPYAATNPGAPARWTGAASHPKTAASEWSTPPLDLHAARPILRGFGFDTATTPDQLIASQALRSVVSFGPPFGDDGYPLVVINADDALPRFTASVSHTGSFTQGQTGAAFTITVQNTRTAPSSSMVSVTDLFSPGMTPHLPGADRLDLHPVERVLHPPGDPARGRGNRVRHATTNGHAQLQPHRREGQSPSAINVSAAITASSLINPCWKSDTIVVGV